MVLSHTVEAVLLRPVCKLYTASGLYFHIQTTHLIYYKNTVHCVRTVCNYYL